MAITAENITDKTSTVPPNSEPVPEEGSGLPTEVLELPIFSAILQGSPAALYTETGNKSIEATTAVKNQKALGDVGIFLYRDKPSKLDLIFNGQFISKELLDTAAKKGKLKEVASSLEDTLASLNGTAAPGPAGGGSLPAAGTPSPVPVDSSLNTARVNSLQPNGPTSGNFPGAGRVLNSITQNAI